MGSNPFYSHLCDTKYCKYHAWCYAYATCVWMRYHLLHKAKWKLIKKRNQELACKNNTRKNKKVAHRYKSGHLVLVKNKQLIGMGCGQTSRVDACKQAIDKAVKMGFDTHGSVMASDAFFPFPDCVEIASKAGIKAVIQPGGSIKDQLSIDFCNENQIPMLFTGLRHFKH